MADSLCHSTWKRETFSSSLVSDDHDEQILEYHSVLNVLNVVSVLADVHSIEASSDHSSSITQEVSVISSEIQHQPHNRESIINRCEGLLNGINRLVKEEIQNDEVESIFREICGVFSSRLDELKQRGNDLLGFITISPEELESSLKEFFMAVEKNSCGLYHVVYREDQKGQNDYVVKFEFVTDEQGKFTMPGILTDSIRDLAANARKYTEPGGEILIKLNTANRFIELSVEDNGRGIPREDIKKVVGFGVRGSNVGDTRTLGGGFGLTKALSIATQLKGYMEIASDLGSGTKITLKIPKP